MTYRRNEEGFAKALAAAKWYASFHGGRRLVLFVHRALPAEYVTALPELVSADMIEPNTTANLIGADGNMTPLFGS